jgi:hypothetical protein
MKSDLLSLHLLYQLLDPIKYWLIRDAGCQNTVMLDLTVEFDTLFTHGIRLKVTGGKQPNACYLMTATGLFCFSRNGRGYVARFGTMRPWYISWVTALAGCLGMSLPAWVRSKALLRGAAQESWLW